MKLKKAHFFIFIIVLSCTNNNELPEGIISEDKMVSVLTEIEITQALVKLKFSHQDTIIDQKALFNDLYHKFNITQEQFNTSLDYYSRKPKLLEGMYVKVISNLSEKQAFYQ